MAERFLQDTDYDDQIRREIREMLDNTTEEVKLKQAEQKSIAQMKMWLSARYDVAAIFAVPDLEGPDTRNAFIVMTLVDIVLYHLWSKERGKMPQVRNDRYQDAIDWLKKVGNGELLSDLPTLPEEEFTGGPQIYSLHAPNDNKY